MGVQAARKWTDNPITAAWIGEGDVQSGSSNIVTHAGSEKFRIEHM